MQTFKPAHFINRELSWLEFNQRVLDEALDERTPLLERVKFFCITGSNLDEFFEVRVAGLKQQIESDVSERSVDGLTPMQTFRAIVQRGRRMVDDQYRCWRERLRPALAAHRIRFPGIDELSPNDRAWLDEYYHAEVRPVLTPLSIDPAHPFPQLLNKSLNLMVQLEMVFSGQPLRHLAVVQVPAILKRFVPLPREDGRQDYLWLGRVIGHYLADLFPGASILGYWQFRITRNSELYIDEEELANLLKAVENELHNRRRGDAVRLEIETGCPVEIRHALQATFHLGPEDVYQIDGPLSPGRLMALCEGDHSPELRDAPFLAPLSARVEGCTDLFAAIREGDILLHHPYESFRTILDWLDQAAADPDVLAIKQTLYRTGGDTRLIGALMKAARNGKQVTVVVELRARFDEASNIQWARALEDAGVHVVYGLVSYKIHSKTCLIVRRDRDGIRRYVHLGTGNYNASTARLYTDLGMLTCRPEFGEDATTLFNLLTGISQFRGLRKFLTAPFDLHERILAMIDRETHHARQRLPARIVAKMNSLSDDQIIQALYRASGAGVQIDLIVRGICCLRPGLPGISRNITVRSIVDRFLEHSRIVYFENACQPEVYVGSADWMPRNFFRRVEVVWPIEDGKLRERVIKEILALTLADNVKARHLNPSGAYELAVPSLRARRRRSQFEFIARALRQEPLPSASGGRARPPKLKLAARPAPPP
ncbi:MAG: polyphosphate kinase 1 [Verrucomicrobia bacterium]|nr:polyphosphate kinase 1 [Verrucomicrobiota bacterium]